MSSIVGPLTWVLCLVAGAGKTTTMGMITGDISATGGGAFIAGHNATGGTNDGVAEARKNIGFCPQKDPYVFDVLCSSPCQVFFNS